MKSIATNEINLNMHKHIPEKPLPTKNIATYSLPYIDANLVEELLTKQVDIPKKIETTRSKLNP